MFEQFTHPDGIVTWQSSHLREIGVIHAFSTRIGGVSSGSFTSLNLGNLSDAAQQDVPANVDENYRRLMRALDCPPDCLRAWVSQVHGRTVALIEPEPENEYAESLDAVIRDRFSGQLAADAIVSIAPGILLSIRIADCVPILIAAPDGHTVAAVHAGWRGIVGNVIARAVRAMHEAAAAPLSSDRLVAAIGPAISAEYFEVGPEVAAEFTAGGLGVAVRSLPGIRPHIDLAAAAALQLRQAGVARIDAHPFCTFRDDNEFFSHRRDRGITGRMAAVIMARTPHP